MASKVLLALLTGLSLGSASCLPSIIGLIRNPAHTLTYSPPFIPSPATNGTPAARLIIIGDVHGMHAPLVSLLEKANFSAQHGDRVIFAGDMVNKGPDSAAVVQLAMDIGAASVRGNHEDSVLRNWAGVEVARRLAEANGQDGDDAARVFEAGLSGGEKEALATARQMSAEQRQWSAQRPVVLKLGKLAGLGETAVVHAGLTPGLDIAEQDPWSMYQVRSLLVLDKDGQFPNAADKSLFDQVIAAKLEDMRPGVNVSEEQLAMERKAQLERYAVRGSKGGFVPTDEWTNEKSWWVPKWNEIEAKKPAEDRLSLIYGHDSKRGLQLHNFTIGLDSKCVDGFQLSALVLEPARSETGEVTLRQDIVSVDCAAAAGK